MEEQTDRKNEPGKKRLKLFISYSHKDKEYREELNGHLSQLLRDGLIEIWSDLQILAGDVWHKEIVSKLNNSDIILLLVSADFICSEFCYCTEMKIALERHKNNESIVIPVLLRDVDWGTSELAELQALPEGGVPVKKWSDRDEAFANVARGIRKSIKERQARDFPIDEKSIDSKDGKITALTDATNGSREIISGLQINNVLTKPAEYKSTDKPGYSDDPVLPPVDDKVGVISTSPYIPPTIAPVDGCEPSPHRNSGLLPIDLVSIDSHSENFGAVEILFAFFFGLLLCGINILQRVIFSTEESPEHLRDALNLNLAMGSSAFFLTAEILLFLNYESEKISLFIKGITRRLIFSYLFALCVIEVVSHLDSFVRDGFILLIVGQVIFFITNAIEAFIDLKVAACYKRISYHYKMQSNIYKAAGACAVWALLLNVAVSIVAIMAKNKRWWEFDERYILLGNFIINSAILLVTRWKISHIKEED